MTQTDKVSYIARVHTASGRGDGFSTSDDGHLEIKLSVPCTLGTGTKYVFLGVPMVIRLSGKQTGGQFTLIEGTMPPGGDGGLHVHMQEDESMYLLEGELDVTIGDESFIRHACESYFAPRGVPHRIRNRSSAPARSLVIHNPAGFDEFVRQAGIPQVAWIPGASASPEQLEHIVEVAASFGIKLLEPPGGE